MNSIKRWGCMVAVAAATGMLLQGCATTGAAGSGQASAGPTTTTASGHEKAVVKADTKENFEAVVAAIHKQMEPGGRWQYIDKHERGTIDGSFADMRKLYDKFGSVDKMDQPAKQRLLADQTTINAILTRKDGERLICKNTLPIGSHLPVRTCKTYAQLQAEWRHTQQQFDQINQQGRKPVQSQSLTRPNPQGQAPMRGH